MYYLVSGRGKDSNQYLKLHGYDTNPFCRMLTGIVSSTSTHRVEGDNNLSEEMFNVTYLTGPLITTTYKPPKDYLKYLGYSNNTTTIISDFVGSEEEGAEDGEEEEPDCKETMTIESTPKPATATISSPEEEEESEADVVDEEQAEGEPAEQKDENDPIYRVSPTRGRLKQIIYELTHKTCFQIQSAKKYSYDLMPFYWSAGLLLDDDCFHKSIDYARDHMLLENPDLILHKVFWNLTGRTMRASNKELLKDYADLKLDEIVQKGINSYVKKMNKKSPKLYKALSVVVNPITNALGRTAQFGAEQFVTRFEKTLLKDCRPLTQGQRYVDIKMKVYKAEHACMTSLVNFNVRQCGYQQVPWMINLDGLPIFARSGCGKWVGEDCVNFNQPVIDHDDNILMVTYVTTNYQFYEEFGDAKKSENIPIHLFWPTIHLQNSNTFKTYKVKEQAPRPAAEITDGNYFNDDNCWWIIETPTMFLACLSNHALKAYDSRKFKKFPFHGGKYPGADKEAQSESREPPIPSSSLVTGSYYVMGSPKKSVSFVFKMGIKTNYVVDNQRPIDVFVNAELKHLVISNRTNDDTRLLRLVKKGKKTKEDPVYRHNTKITESLKSGFVDDLMKIIMDEVSKQEKKEKEKKKKQAAEDAAKKAAEEAAKAAAESASNAAGTMG